MRGSQSLSWDCREEVLYLAKPPPGNPETLMAILPPWWPESSANTKEGRGQNWREAGSCRTVRALPAAAPESKSCPVVFAGT